MDQRKREQLFWDKVDKNGPVPPHRPELGPCWLWTASTDKKGYGYFAGTRAHRFALHLDRPEYFNPLLSDLLVLHRCDNPSCVRASHLFLGTSKDNSQDMVQKNRVARGSRIGISKLTEEAVKEIRRRFTAGERQHVLVKAFGVSNTVIRMIIRRKTWTHI